MLLSAHVQLFHLPSSTNVQENVRSAVMVSTETVLLWAMTQTTEHPSLRLSLLVVESQNNHTAATVIRETLYSIECSNTHNMSALAASPPGTAVRPARL